MGDIDNFQLVIDSLRTRSRKARRTAWFSVSLIIITVFLMLSFFYLSDIVRGALGVKITIPGGYLTPRDEQIKETDPELRRLLLELELKKAELRKSTTESEQMAKTIAESAAKIGAVFIAIYLVQILLSLTRYHFRMADHLDVA